MSKFHQRILKIFSANAASIEPSFYNNFAGIQTRIPSTPPIRDRLQGEFLYDQLIAQKPSTLRIELSIDRTNRAQVRGSRGDLPS